MRRFWIILVIWALGAGCGSPATAPTAPPPPPGESDKAIPVEEEQKSVRDHPGDMD